MDTNWRQIEAIVDGALSEDSGWGDATTRAVIPADLSGRGSLVVKGEGVLAGVEVARMVFQRFDPVVEVDVMIADGGLVRPGDVVMGVEGPATSILTAERVALNFLQRLSGVASETRRYVEAVRGFSCCIVDTRKTTPGLRLLEKLAVVAGGGCNHRLHLGDGVLIKDNHLAALRTRGIGLREVAAKARERAPFTLRVEVEVGTPEEALEAVDGGADIVMLDNMRPDEMRRAVELVGGRALLEASGGITLDNVREVAAVGVDLISIGALTHSARALDISLEM